MAASYLFAGGGRGLLFLEQLDRLLFLGECLPAGGENLVHAGNLGAQLTALLDLALILAAEGTQFLHGETKKRGFVINTMAQKIKSRPV